MTSVTLELREEDGKPVEHITGIFDDKDLEILRKFIRYISRVRECALLQRGMPTISNISINANVGMKLTSEPYTNSELHDLLHVLRPVILQNEAASFQNVLGLLGKRFSNRKFSDYLKATRLIFEHGELKGYMQITLGDQPLFDQSILNIWLNAAQYHTDEEKEKNWLSLENSLSTDNARALIIAQLHSKVKALFRLESIAGMVVEKCQCL